MKPPGKPFLNEQGVTITQTLLTTPEHSFDLAKIHSARIERITRSGFLPFLFKRDPVFRLMVWRAKLGSPVCAFETKDVEFVGRVQRAMDQAARANP